MIISLHYPKTAGTSFRRTLTNIYGNKLYLHYDEGMYLDRDSYNDKEIIHGHLRIKKYRELFPDAPIITWLRDPAERTLSYYNYRKYKITSDISKRTIPDNRRFVAFLNSDGFDVFVKKFDLFFGDYNVDDFLFIGITERYREDMNRLSRMMGWGKCAIYDVNKSRNYEKIVLTDKIRKFIYQRMSREYDMYKSCSK